MESIFAEHKKFLKNLDVPHKPLILGMAGIPGSGKTTIATVIEDKYKGVRIHNDSIRGIIQKHVQSGEVVAENVEKVLQTYLLYCLTTLTGGIPNKFYILDSGIERRYQQVKEWCDKNGYSLLIISLGSTAEESMERIHKRNPDQAVNYLRDMPRYVKENADFHERVKADIFLPLGPASNTKELFAFLDNRIQ